MNGIEVKYENNQMIVSSVEVAKNFNKKHKTVLNTIRELKGVAQNSASLFYESSYTHDQNKQEYPMYYMNRDGFSLLVMGFTGKEALEWKMKYIQAFNEMEKKLNNPEFLVQRTMEYLKSRCDALLLENKIQSQQINELKPKADYYDQILKTPGLLNITQIAKDYGMSGTAMNKLLSKLKVQYKQSGQWLLYSKYQSKGYTRSETVSFERSNGIEDSTLHTKWTQKGRLFLYELLRKNGILPIIEQNQESDHHG